MSLDGITGGYLKVLGGDVVERDLGLVTRQQRAHIGRFSSNNIGVLEQELPSPEIETVE